MIEFEKKIIYEDNNLHDRLLTAGELVIELVNQLADRYKVLELGDFTQEVYNSILAAGIQPIEEKYQAGLNKSVRLLGLKNKIIIDNILSGADEYFEDFQKAFLKLIRGVSVTGKPFGISSENEIKFPNEFISIDKKGRGYVSDTTIEEIKNRHCRIFLEDPDQEQLYNAVKSLEKVYNDLLLPAIQKIRYSHHFEGLYALDTFLLEDPETKKISIIPEAIPYVTQYNAWKKNINEFNSAFAL